MFDSLEDLPVEILHLCFSFIDIKSVALLTSLNRRLKDVTCSYLLSFGLNNQSSVGIQYGLSPKQYAFIINQCKYTECCNLFDIRTFYCVDGVHDNILYKRRRENEALWKSIERLIDRNKSIMRQIHLNIVDCPYTLTQVLQSIYKLKNLRTLSLLCRKCSNNNLFELMNNLPLLTSLRIHTQTEMRTLHKVDASLQNSFKNNDNFSNLKTLNFKNFGKGLFEKDKDTGLPLLFIVCPNLQELCYSSSTYKVCFPSEAVVKSWEYKTSKFTKLEIHGTNTNLIIDTPLIEIGNSNYCLFHNLVSLKFTCHASGAISIFKKLKFSPHLKEAIISSSFARYLLPTLLATAVQLKKLILIDCAHLESTINETQLELALVSVEHLQLEVLHLGIGSIQMNDLFYILAISPYLRRFSTSSLEILSRNSEPNAYNYITLGLRYIEMIKTTMSIEALFDLLTISSTGLEKFLAFKSAWIVSSNGTNGKHIYLPKLSHLIIDECSGSGLQLVDSLQRNILPSLRYLSLKNSGWMSEQQLIQLLSQTPGLTRFHLTGIRCSDAILKLITEKHYMITELGLEGNITEDGLLSLGDAVIANLEEVSLMSCILTSVEKMTQFIKKTRQLQVLKLNFDPKVKLTSNFFYAVRDCCSNSLRTFICGGKGDEEVISNNKIIADLILECKHLNTFVLDFCPQGIDVEKLLHECRKRLNRSAVPTIILSKMTQVDRSLVYNEDDSSCIIQ